jgi:chromosome segregation ATPase
MSLLEDMLQTEVAKLEAEVARLREELSLAGRQCGEVVERCGDDLATERAAHEALGAQLATLQQVHADAVTELVGVRDALEREKADNERLRALLELATGAIDEACYPVWWAKWRAFLGGAVETPKPEESTPPG